MNFLDSLRETTNYTITENGALTHKSSLDPVVDFFALAGAMRDRPGAAADLFQKAYSEDPLTALRTLFYIRDVRGGQGERKVFRSCFHRLWQIDVERAQSLVHHIPEYGRWDDVFAVPVNEIGAVAHVIWDQLQADLDSERPSLLAKWLPSENASSKQTKLSALALRRNLGYSSRAYRKVLSKLRARIRLLEQDMSTNNWTEIDYSKLPSQAHRKHVKAFKRHTPERYQAYLDSVTRGEAKINVSTVFPYEIFEMITGTGYAASDKIAYANVAWEALPDYTGGEDALVLADVSASMNGRPMSVSVSLALYFAERNKGLFKGYFMTFSEEPELVKISGNNLRERFMSIARSRWGYNTNLSKALRAILDAAVKADSPPPKVFYIISDMEFDQAAPGNKRTIFQQARKEFAAKGFELPHIVFWNVDARQDQAPALAHDNCVSLVSGCSPTIFAQAVQGKTPRELVDQVVHSERYERITL